MKIGQICQFLFFFCECIKNCININVGVSIITKVNEPKIIFVSMPNAAFCSFMFILLCLFPVFFCLTDFLRLEVLIQEKTIEKLQEHVRSLTDLNRKCDRQHRKDRQFLQTLIENYKRDNVPLTEEQCSKYCTEHKVKGKDCEKLCISKRVQCAHWPDTSKCLKHTGKGSNRRKKRDSDAVETTLIHSPGCLSN